MSDDNTRENKKADLDQDQSVANWSKVSIKKNNNWMMSKTVWITAAVVLLIFIAMLSSHQNQKLKSQQEGQASFAIKTDDSELQSNIARLKSMQQAVEKQAKSLAILPNQNLPASKEIIARQNAPTSMYQISANTNQISTVTQAASLTSGASATLAPTFAGNNTFAAFGNQAMVSTAVAAQKIAHPDYTIASGEFLHAVLETAINSDLPGEIRAVVSEPVYAYVGETPLIPAGSRLIGQYSSSVTEGQNRVFVIWNRVILPSGISAQLNSPGEDALGVAGEAADDVNTHFFTRFGEASLLSIIGAGVSNAGVSNTDQYNSAAQYRMAISQSFQQSAGNSLQETLPMKATLSIDQGAAINVFVAHDIDFDGVLNHG